MLALIYDVVYTVIHKLNLEEGNMNEQTLQTIIDSDIFGLLDTEQYPTRYGIVYGYKGNEKITMKRKSKTYDNAAKIAKELRFHKFEGCIIREIKKDGEWQLVATEEFTSV